MIFWWFMLFISLLCPLLMILFGILFVKSPPKAINHLYGFRTAMSMKNNDTWRFAHWYCGALWWKGGLILLPLSLVPMMLTIRQNMTIIAVLGLVITLLDLAVMLLSIYATEKALRKAFDRDGLPYDLK